MSSSAPGAKCTSDQDDTRSMTCQRASHCPPLSAEQASTTLPTFNVIQMLEDTTPSSHRFPWILLCCGTMRCAVHVVAQGDDCQLSQVWGALLSRDGTSEGNPPPSRTPSRLPCLLGTASALGPAWEQSFPVTGQVKLLSLFVLHCLPLSNTFLLEGYLSRARHLEVNL